MNNNKSKLVDMHFTECMLPLKTDSLTVALIQIEGPLPNGKHLSVVGSTRQTYAWRDLKEMDGRIAKAIHIIRHLKEAHSGIDVFVFPEYSLPVERALSQLREVSRETGSIIIPGADCVRQRRGEIYVQSSVLLPDRDPVLVTKATLSKWEQGYVDAPSTVTNPIFTWKAGESSYSLTVFLCLDLVLASRALEKLPNAHPGVIIAPMDSPDVDTFRAHADSLLRSELGMAVLLANCVGEGACGRSAVYAVTADGTSLRPAVELSTAGEAAAVCEIRCNHLAPPRKTIPGQVEGLGKRYVYTIKVAGGAVSLGPSDDANHERKRAVLNPALFDMSGKKMRLAFLAVDEFPRVADNVRGCNFEVLAILGQHDIAVTHLHDTDYGLIVDVTQRIPIRHAGGSGSDHGSILYEDFPYFQVEVYYKVLGVPVSTEERNVFAHLERPFPTSDQLVRIMALGDDWDAPNVSPEERESFLKHRWILATTSFQPGEIDAIMTIHLNYFGTGVFGPLARFTERVLPVLVGKRQISSIYRGIGHSIAMEFVLRMTASREQLFDLIDEIHHLAGHEKILITTSTYVVMKRLSNLDLAAACLHESLPPKEQYLWNKLVAPLLSAEEFERAKQIPVALRGAFISTFMELQHAVQYIPDSVWGKRRDELVKRAAIGFLFKDLSAIRDLHNLLQEHVERILAEQTGRLVSEDDLKQWRQELAIPPGKTTTTLTYTERIKVLIHVCKLARLDGSWEQGLSALVTTTKVRNDFTHGRTQQLDDAEVLAAIKTYSSFLLEK